MGTTEGLVYNNETVTMDSYTLPPNDGISRVGRPPFSLSKCDIQNFYVLSVVGSAVVLFGLIGNALTISVMWKACTKSATYFLLVVLAISDTLVNISYWVVSAPISFALIFLNMRICTNLYSVSIVYMGGVTNTFLMATIWMTVLITWQRYLSVCLPHKLKILGSIHKAKVLTLAITIFSLLFNIPRYFERRLIYDQPRPGFISFADTALRQSEAYNLWYGNILFYLFSYFLPSLALIYMTGALIVGLKKAAKRRQEMMNTVNVVQKNNEEITLSLIVVVITFMICHFMAPVRRILLFLNPGSDAQNCGTAFTYFQPYVVLSIEISSAANFIIYILCVKRFRQRLITMCRRGFRIEPQSTTTHGQDSGNQRHTSRLNNVNPKIMQTGPIHSSFV